MLKAADAARSAAGKKTVMQGKLGLLGMLGQQLEKDVGGLQARLRNPTASPEFMIDSPNPMIADARQTYMQKTLEAISKDSASKDYVAGPKVTPTKLIDEDAASGGPGCGGRPVAWEA